jgi:hypothetical protein
MTTEPSNVTEPQAEPAGHGERHAQGVVEARLGRPPRDVLEATIVLEAWTGAPTRSAMSKARRLVDPDGPAARVKGRLDPNDDRDQQSVVAEGLTLVLSILSVAAWATPLGKVFGHPTLAQAIRVALPLAVALQWGLRSRYLSRRDGLSFLAEDGLLFGVLAIAIELPLVMLHQWGQIAAMFVAIWVAGAVMTRRGWGLVYALGLVVGTVALDDSIRPYIVLGLMTTFTVLLAVAGVVGSRRRTDERAGSVPRALGALLLGGCIGVLLVADPSLGWGVHGLHPAIALLPSVFGSFWGGYYLWNLYEAIPRRLQGVPLSGASRAAVGDPAMSIFLGAVFRLVGATVVLSALVIFLGRFTKGTDELSVFVAFGCVALVSLLVGLLESLALQRAAFIAAIAALVAELSWRYVVHTQVSGAALAVGAAVGVLLATPPLVARLARSGRVLATMLWIQ